MPLYPTMLAYKLSVVGLTVASLCVLSCYCSSETVETATASSQPGSDQQTPTGDVPETTNSEEEAADDGKSQQEKLVVAFVPDYPSKVVHPGMLANTSHFIMFYASWCPHSDAALPHFKDTLQHVVDQNITGLHLGKIQITKNAAVVKNFKIKSTPTFAMYHRGARYVYNGDVSSHHLIDFLQRVLAINLTEVSTARELSEIQSHHPVVFMVVYSGQTDPDWHYAYSVVAQERGLLAKFVFTTKTDLVQDFNVTKFPTLLVLKDGGAYKFSDSLSTHNLGKWVSRERHPAFPRVNEETFRPFTKLLLGSKLVVLLVHEDPSQQRITEKRLVDTVRRLAKSRKLFPQYQFVQLTSISLAERMLQSVVPEVPYLFIYDPLTGQYYLFQSVDDGKGVTEAAIKDFCYAVRKGNIEPLGGGRSIWTIFQSWWTRLYTIYQAMVAHYPWLSMGAGFSLCSVAIFYTFICLRRPSHPAPGRGRKRARAAAAACSKAKRQQTRLAASAREQNGSAVRRRRGKVEEGEEEEEGASNGESEQASSQDSSDDTSHRHNS